MEEFCFVYQVKVEGNNSNCNNDFDVLGGRGCQQEGVSEIDPTGITPAISNNMASQSEADYSNKGVKNGTVTKKRGHLRKNSSMEIPGKNADTLKNVGEPCTNHTGKMSNKSAHRTKDVGRTYMLTCKGNAAQTASTDRRLGHFDEAPSVELHSAKLCASCCLKVQRRLSQDLYEKVLRLQVVNSASGVEEVPGKRPRGRPRKGSVLPSGPY